MPSPRRLAAVVAVCLATTGPIPAQTSAPVEAESHERALREEKVRHADVMRRLREEEDRLRTALDAARGRLAEAEARRASLGRLLDEIERAGREIQSRLAEGRAALAAIERSLATAVAGIAGRTPVPPDLRGHGTSLARRLRTLFQILDRELLAARRVSVSPRERGGVLGHEVRLGAIATFFLPAGGGAAVLEPSGRELPTAIGSALRDVIGQLSRRGRRSLVRIPWWGES